MKTLLHKLILLSFAVFLFSCASDESCALEELQVVNPAELACTNYEDFSNYNVLGYQSSAQNWRLGSSAKIGVLVNSGNKYLSARGDFLFPLTSIYNKVDFPKNFIEAGCVLQYDFSFTSSDPNIETFGSITIEDPSRTIRANFILSKPVGQGSQWNTIEIPLYLANPDFPTALPNNEYGYWSLVGGNDALKFNEVIQNVYNVLFFPVPEQKFPGIVTFNLDNFCFKTCPGV